MMKKKKILMLGGALAQIPSIIRAKEMGLYVITCDYLPNNPGHKFADEYHNVSTTDKEGVLSLAKLLDIDGVVCYASDPAAPTAAYVCEKLGLPTSPYESVEILSNKDSFRNFLAANNFYTPKAVGGMSYDEIKSVVVTFRMPVIVKPVDSSGSKGITRIFSLDELSIAIDKALEYSRCKRILVEEYVESVGAPLAGDIFSVNGKIVFWAFADDHFDVHSLNSMAPIAETYPYSKSQYIQKKVLDEIQRLLELLKMQTTAYNIEARIDREDNVYLMEVGPRNGGNEIPVITRMATGVDMIEYTIKAALGEDCSDLEQKPVEGYWSTYMVHSNKSGVFKSIELDEEYKNKNYIGFVNNYSEGDFIPAFSGANGSMGTMLSRYSSYEEMMDKVYNFERYVKVNVE